VCYRYSLWQVKPGYRFRKKSGDVRNPIRPNKSLNGGNRSIQKIHSSAAIHAAQIALIKSRKRIEKVNLSFMLAPQLRQEDRRVTFVHTQSYDCARYAVS
jgi:hypothetical protein